MCTVCLGYGCMGQLPGMGGIRNSENFILNCKGWKLLPDGPFEYRTVPVRLAPMTGGQMNVGHPDEEHFYTDMIGACVRGGIELSIGDGSPDTKLLWGIKAVREAGKKAAVFIKPYENRRVLERLEWAQEIASHGGIDIDAYNIATMRNQAKLEKKTASNLNEIKKFLSGRGIPFVIKGIFTREDMDLVRELRPDVAFVSNHGGRVDGPKGSTAEFLRNNIEELKKNCGNVWVDGGIRDSVDYAKAVSWGADEVLVGRPFATAVLPEFNGVFPDKKFFCGQ